jgi:PhnB protein
MPQAVQNPPAGYHSLTPYMTVRDAQRGDRFLPARLRRREGAALDMPDGSVAHAEVRIGDSIVMLSEENEQWGTKGPLTLGGSPMFLMAYVPDVDAAFRRAIEAGATEVRPVADQFYGDRSGTLKDPFGHQWTLSTHIEDVSEAEAQRRMEAEFSKS